MLQPAQAVAAPAPRPRSARALLPAPAPCEATGEARPAPPDARCAPRAGGTLLTVIAPFVNIQFLGSSLTFMMVRAAAPSAGTGNVAPAWGRVLVLSGAEAWRALAGRRGRAPERSAGAQVYVWGRRHQYVNLSFLGIFNFTAPYLPWVLLAFSVVLRSSPVVDLLGMVAGAAPPRRRHCRCSAVLRLALAGFA